MATVSYVERLEQAARARNSIVSMGLDPELDRIPLQIKDPEKKILKFFTYIYEALHAERTRTGIGAVKPNYAYYAQYGFPGLRALKKVIQLYAKSYIVILDAKRGDIGKTNAVYAKECFDFWGADAVTLSPYLGRDSIEPYLDYCKKGKGIYVLVRTSNPGASQLQNLQIHSGELVYQRVAQMLIDMKTAGVGAVVGATSLPELQDIAQFFSRERQRIPLLIPGVGRQGGSAAEVARALNKSGQGKGLAIHRVHASASITYAWEKNNESDYAGAAVKAIVELNRELDVKF